MIVFMLDRSREKTARFDLKHLAFQRLRAHKDRVGSFNVSGDLGKASATFHPQLSFARNSISGLISTIGIALFGSTSLPLR